MVLTSQIQSDFRKVHDRKSFVGRGKRSDKIDTKPAVSAETLTSIASATDKSVIITRASDVDKRCTLMSFACTRSCQASFPFHLSISQTAKQIARMNRPLYYKRIFAMILFFIFFFLECCCHPIRWQGVGGSRSAGENGKKNKRMSSLSTVNRKSLFFVVVCLNFQ